MIKARAFGVLLCAGLGLIGTVAVIPPFHGTIFIDPDIVTPEDPTSYESLIYSGRGNRVMYDRRVNNWTTRNAFLFDARFDDGLGIEVQVNPEFETEEAARQEALRYMHAIGQLPNALRRDVKTVWLHKGKEPFGGGNNNLLIHSGQGDEYLREGILEETFQHEASHTSLDAEHARAPGWLAAQAADLNFISNYARDNPLREDVAESFVPYFAARYRRDRISESLSETIEGTIPHRMTYFDSLNLDLYPAVQVELALRDWTYDAKENVLALTWTSRANRRYVIESSADLRNWQQHGGELSGVAGKTTNPVALEEGGYPQFFRIRQQ
jgi:hypothetical protein